MILVPRLLCSCFVIGLFLWWWLTSPCYKNLGILFFFGIFRKLQDIPMIWLWFWWILSKFAVCLIVCYKKLATSEKVSKNVILNILFLFCFFLCLIVCCFDVPFSIGQRRPYIIPCTSVDEFKTARSAEGKILLNIIGFLNILWEFYRIFRSDTGEFRNQFWIYSGKTLRPFLLFLCVCVFFVVFVLFFCFFCSLLG